MNDKIDNDNSEGVDDFLDATQEELDVVRRLIGKGSLELSLELWDGEPRIRVLVIRNSYGEPLGRIRLQTLISHQIFVTVDMARSGEDPEQCRSYLFSLSGRLKELSQLADEQARALNDDIENWRSVPCIESFSEESELG